MALHIAVTGAAAGIGAQVAIDLAAAGRAVWCLDRDAAGLAGVASVSSCGGGERHTAAAAAPTAAVAGAAAPAQARTGGRCLARFAREWGPPSGCLGIAAEAFAFLLDESIGAAN